MASSNPKSDFLKAASHGDLSRLKRLALEIGNGEGLALEIGNGKGLMKVVDAEGCNALHLAAASGKTQMCKFLIEDFKFDINSRERKGNTPLIAAIERRQHTTAVYLVESGADIGLPNDGGFAALHSAARTGQKEIMCLLLSKGVPDLNTAKVFTPLQCAALQGQKQAVKLLLDHGADPNATLELYCTPLTMAVAAKSLECMELLLKAGADPNLSSSGKTPLILAACEGDTRIIKHLLKAGANPDVVERSKKLTPLEHAALRGHVDAVKTLFPVTSRISSISDWSVDGLLNIKHAYSGEGLKQMVSNKTDYFEKSKAKGREAFERKDYFEAIYWYTEADKVDPIHEEVLSNRSLCWGKLNQGHNALNDAEACVGLNPDWPKGHYRLGAAWMLLHEYSKAVEAFAKALELDPKNKDIKKAHREAVEAELAARMSGAAVS